MVYFVQSVHGGPIKIGKANDPAARRVDLEAGSPVPLLLLATAPGGKTEERWLHQRFAACRERGEWFSPVPALLSLIDELNYRKPGTFSLLTLLDLVAPRSRPIAA